MYGREELDRQISEATCPKCEARDCDIEDDLEDVRHCQHCHHFWSNKDGVELPYLSTQEIEQRIALFERITAKAKLPKAGYRRMWLGEIAECLGTARECLAKTDGKHKEAQQNATALLTIVEHKMSWILRIT
jgi:hypothetical protein